MLKRGLVAGASTKSSYAYVCWSCELRQLAALRAHRSHTPVSRRAFATTSRLAQDAEKSKDDAPSEKNADSKTKSKKAVKGENVEAGSSNTATRPSSAKSTPGKPAKGRKRSGKPVAGLARTKDAKEGEDAKPNAKPKPVAAHRSKKKAPIIRKTSLLSVRKIPGNETTTKLQQKRLRRIEVIRELMRKIKERSQPRTSPNRELHELKEEGVPFSKLPSNITMQDAMGRGVPKGTKTNTIKTGDIQFKAIDTGRGKVPRLSNGLDRVLFSQGITEVRDSRSRVYNFDPHLDKLIPVKEFDFSTLGTFTTPSQDPVLADVAAKSGKKFVGSTSSMTGLLKHLHYLLSDWREVNLKSMSKSFPSSNHPISFTKVQKAPEAVFLRYKNGTYAVDADKSYDSGNILSMLGQYMEKLMTVPKDVFERHRVGESHRLTPAERNVQDSYHYSTVDDFVVRSQLDAYDPRLPDEGMFDLKTRAVLPIRMSVRDHEWGMDYNIKQQHGEYESYEREYHDMARATMLKYSLQVRLGRMGGIFVAYHNIARIFGFQYIGLDELDLILHGQRDRTLGDQELASSLRILNDVFSKAIAKWPEQSLRLHLETRAGSVPWTYIFIEPVTEEQVKKIQSAKKANIEAFNRKILGLEPLESDKKPVNVSNSKVSDPSTEELKTANAAETAKAVEAAETAETSETVVPDAETTSPEAPIPLTFATEKESAPNNEDNSDIPTLNVVNVDVTEPATTVLTESQPESPEPKIPFVAPASTPVTIKKTAFGAVEEPKSGVPPPEDVAIAYAQYKHGEASTVAPPENPNESVSNSGAGTIGSQASVHEDSSGPKVSEEPPVNTTEKPLSESPQDLGTAVDQSEYTDDIAHKAPDAADEHSAQTAKVDEFVQELINDQVSTMGSQPSATREKMLEQKVDDSVSSGDTRFLEKVAQKVAKVEQQKPDGPILGYVLRARSFVDGKHVDRPSNLSSDQEWTLQYTLTEIESSERAWSLYGALKTRRSALLNKSEEDDVRQGDYFIDKLKRITAGSKAWREQQDADDAGKPIVIWNQAPADTEQHKAQDQLGDVSGSTSQELPEERFVEKTSGETIEKTTEQKTGTRTAKEPVKQAERVQPDSDSSYRRIESSPATISQHANQLTLIQEARKEQEDRQRQMVHSLKGLTDLLMKSKSQMQDLYDLNKERFNELKGSFDSFRGQLGKKSVSASSSIPEAGLGTSPIPEAGQTSLAARVIQITIDEIKAIRSSVSRRTISTADGESAVKASLMALSFHDIHPSNSASRPAEIPEDEFCAAWDEEVSKIIDALSDYKSRTESGEFKRSKFLKELRVFAIPKLGVFFGGTIPIASAHGTTVSISEEPVEEDSRRPQSQDEKSHATQQTIPDAKDNNDSSITTTTADVASIGSLEAVCRSDHLSLSKVLRHIDKVLSAVQVTQKVSLADGEQWIKKLLAAAAYSGDKPYISPPGDWQKVGTTTEQHNKAWRVKVVQILRAVKTLWHGRAEGLELQVQALFDSSNGPWFGATSSELEEILAIGEHRHEDGIESNIELQELPRTEPYTLDSLLEVLATASKDLETIQTAVLVEKSISLPVGERMIKRYLLALSGERFFKSNTISTSQSLDSQFGLEEITSQWRIQVLGVTSTFEEIRKRVMAGPSRYDASGFTEHRIHKLVVAEAVWSIKKLFDSINAPLFRAIAPENSLASMESTFRFDESDWMSKSPASTFAAPEAFQQSSPHSSEVNGTKSSMEPLTVDNQSLPKLQDTIVQDNQTSSRVLEDRSSSNKPDATDDRDVAQDDGQPLMLMDDLPSNTQTRPNTDFRGSALKRLNLSHQSEAGFGEGYLPVETNVDDTVKSEHIETDIQHAVQRESDDVVATTYQSQAQDTIKREAVDEAAQIDPPATTLESEAAISESASKTVDAATSTVDPAQSQAAPTDGKPADAPSAEIKEKEIGIGIFGKLKKRWFG